MDEMDVVDYDGRRFLCSGKLLPSMTYQAVVRERNMDDGLVRTLVLGSQMHFSSWRALVQAKELAVEWALKHPRPDHEQI
jgi:hypothetical protein